jgi:hypothetical protein
MSQEELLKVVAQYNADPKVSNLLHDVLVTTCVTTCQSQPECKGVFGRSWHRLVGRCEPGGAVEGGGTVQCRPQGE